MKGLSALAHRVTPVGVVEVGKKLGLPPASLVRNRTTFSLVGCPLTGSLVSTRSMLGYEVCELFYYDLARPWPPVSEEVAHDLRVTVQFDQKIERRAQTERTLAGAT